MNVIITPFPVRSFAFSVSVCLSQGLTVCPLAYLKNTRPNVTKFSVHVTYGRGWPWLVSPLTTSCTSGFIDDVMFLHNGPNIHTQAWSLRRSKLFIMTLQVALLDCAIGAGGGKFAVAIALFCLRRCLQDVTKCGNWPLIVSQKTEGDK